MDAIVEQYGTYGYRFDRIVDLYADPMYLFGTLGYDLRKTYYKVVEAGRSCDASYEGYVHTADGAYRLDVTYSFIATWNT